MHVIEKLQNKVKTDKTKRENKKTHNHSWSSYHKINKYIILFSVTVE